MGIINREGALYMATGVDNTGLYAGRRETIGIIKALTSQITSFDVFGGIGISAAMAFANAAKSSYDFEKEFRKNMLEVATISTQVSGSMTDFMNRVMAITQQIPVTAPEAAKALCQIVSAGHDGADGMKILEVSAKSAVGGLTDTDTATAADAITTLLNAYKLSADQAANISDQLFTTVRLGKTDFGQLGQSIAQVAPIAASYGVEIDQVLAAVASLTKQGTPTAQAMIQIRAAIIGTSKVLGDGAFESRTFQEALAEVAARANGSESKLRELVPEIEAVNGVLGMTGKNAKSAASDLTELQKSAGATEAAFQKMQEDVDNQMKLLSNNIHAALRPMGEAILKNVSEAAQMINKGFETGDVQNSLESLKKLLIGVAGGYVAYKSSVVGASAAEAFHSAKVTVSNNLKSLQSKITGEAIITKERERVYQEAYTAALEKSITQEQRAKLSKLDLKVGSQEYIKALTDQALQEKKNADNLVESLTKQVNKNKERLASAQENLEMSHKAVDAAKAEFDAAFAANDLAGVEATQTKINAAAQREEAASANVATASKKLKTTQSKLSSAAIAAETAATRVNTAATAADTAVTNVSTTAKGKLKIATSALWGVMKANPIGAVLTAISLATTVYMVFADKIKAAETAQSRLNKLNKAAAESISNETAELNLLLSVAKNELLAKGEREKAIKKLNEISPEYLNNLTLENIGTKEAATSIEAYTRAIGKNAKAKALIDEMNPLYRDQLKYEQELYVLQKKSDDLKTNKLGFSDEQLYYANLDISAQIKNKEAQKAEVDKQIQDVLDMYNDELTKETEKNPIKVEIPVNIQIQSEQANISALLKKKEEIEARIQARKENGLFAEAFDVTQLAAVNVELEKANANLEALNQTSSSTTKEETVLQRQLALTKELAAAEAKLKKLRSSDSTATDNEIDLADKKVKEIKAKLESLTGLSEKDGDKLKQSQSELSRLILDSELKLQSERIAIMQDGKDKRVLLADQEYKETLAAIEKERAEYQKNTRDAGQPEDAAIMATFSSRESAAKDKRDTNVANINKEYFDEYTKRTKALTDVFLSEEKKRLSAVKERYDEERKWANEELKTGGMSGEQYEAYVVNINTAETEESLRGLLDKYQDYATERKRIEEQFQAEIETLEKGRTQNNAANVDAAIAEAREKEREALSNLDLENLQKEINWSTVFGDLEKVSTDTLKRLQEQLKDYLSKVGDTISKEDLKVVTDALTQIGEVQADRRPIDQLKVGYEDYKKACERVAIAQQRVNELEAKGNKTSEEYKKAIEGLTAAQDERRSSLVSMTQAVNSIGQKGSELVQAGNDIVGMLTDLGVEMPESIAGALDGLGQIASSLASIDLTKPFSVVTGITGIIGGIGKAIGSLFNKDHKKEKNIQRLQEQVDALDRSYNKLGDSIEKAYSKDASELIGQQNEMLEQQKVLIQQQIREEEEKKKTDHDRIKQWENELEEIDRVIADNKEKAKDAIFGEDLKSAIDNFANAYAEAWAAGEDRAKSMKDVARSMIRQTVIELIKSSEGLGETVKKIREMIIGYLEDGVIDEWEQKQIDDYIESETSRLDSKYEWADKYLQGDKSIDIGISSDSLSDTILEGLQAGKSGIKDFSSSFEDMMKTAVLNSLKVKYLEGPLKEFQKKFTELSESGGQLTEAEIEELRAMYADIIDGAKVQFDSMKEISGLDFSLDSDNTLKGAFAKASQESIDLLAGQFGAMRFDMEAIRNSMVPIREQLRIIFDLQREGWADVRAIRELTVKIDRNSEQMAKNTDKIQEVAEKISESTKKTAECLDGTISVKVKM